MEAIKPIELAELAKKWVASSHGKRAMKEVLKKAASAKERLEKDRQIDPKSIFEPMILTGKIKVGEVSKMADLVMGERWNTEDVLEMALGVRRALDSVIRKNPQFGWS